MVTELLKKYIWLVETFIRASENGLTLDEVTDKWEDRFGTPYSRRTFNNHREAVAEVFGIEIMCNRSTNRYFIKSSDALTDESAGSAWLINTFTVNSSADARKRKALRQSFGRRHTVRPQASHIRNGSHDRMSGDAHDIPEIHKRTG